MNSWLSVIAAAALALTPACIESPNRGKAWPVEDEGDIGVADTSSHDASSADDAVVPWRLDLGGFDADFRDSPDPTDAGPATDAAADANDDAATDTGPDVALPDFCEGRPDDSYCDGSDVVLCVSAKEQLRDACEHGCDRQRGDCKPVACGDLLNLTQCDSAELDSTNRCAFFFNADDCLPNGLDADAVGACYSNLSHPGCAAVAGCEWYPCVSKCLVSGIDAEDVCPGP